jgi:hypothetical protein
MDKPPLIQTSVPVRKRLGRWHYLALAVVMLLVMDGLFIRFATGNRLAKRAVASPNEQFFAINLSQHTNGVLHTSWLPNEDPGNNLASLPTGRQEIGGVIFDIQGLIQLQGQCWVKRGYVLPERVDGIPVHRHSHFIHILHANSGFGDPRGTVVASLILHYSDGQQAQLDIRHRENVLDFWAWHPETLPDTNAIVAWEGRSPATTRRGFGIRLCRTTFSNPQPQKMIETIDYVSAMAGSAPFLVALTIE